jgi:hypothetical protein
LRFNVGGRGYNRGIKKGKTMRDTKNIYLVVKADGQTFEMETDLAEDATDYLADNYYKGRIARFWVNGVEWQEPAVMLNS